MPSQQQYDDYMAALDKCIDLTRARLHLLFSEDAAEADLLKLDMQIMRAGINRDKKRTAWIEARDSCAA